MQPRTTVDRIDAAVFTIPTDAPEADGTLAWDKTTMVLVEAQGGGRTGLGYSYTDAAAAALIRDKLAPLAIGRDAFDTAATWAALQHAIRNLGRDGLVATAISALDTALWDLKARLLELPLVSLLGAARETVPIYGSGGFTSYSEKQLKTQLALWVERDGCRAVKMKVASRPDQDLARVRDARAAIGDAELFVDGNGGYGRKQAIAFSEAFACEGVTWFEEPVSSDDLDGLRLVRDRAPARIDIAAGEYGYDLQYFRRMLSAGAVDVQQADITRCGGLTAFLRVAALCEAAEIDLSAHCAPSLHLHAACAAPRFRNIEWFHDHVRIEGMLFDGAPRPQDGRIRPDLSRPGLGLTVKRPDCERFRA